MDPIERLLASPFNMVALIIALVPLVAGLLFIALSPKLFRLLLKNLKRNLLRTILTCLATIVLVLMVTLIWTVIYFLDEVTAERAKDLKLIVTEKWSLPSQMPNTHARYLNPKSPYFILYDEHARPLIGPNDFMTWSFYVGVASEDRNKVTWDNLVFFFCMEPEQVLPMMDDIEDLDPKLIQKMNENPEYVLMGRERLERLNKRVGEYFTVRGINQYVNLDLRVTIAGLLPEGRYNQSAIMRSDYFNKALDKYKLEKGPHPLEPYRLNLIWLRVSDRPTYEKVAHIIENSEVFKDREVQCQTASS